LIISSKQIKVKFDLCQKQCYQVLIMKNILKSLTLLMLIIVIFNSITANAELNPSMAYIAKNSTIGGKHPVSYFGVLDTQTGNFQHHKGDSLPLSMASVIKVVVALAVLEDLEGGKYSLNSSAILPSWAYADGSPSTTVKGNIDRMLGPSDNSATNALIVKVGGLDAVTVKAKKNGLTNTSINCLLSPKFINSSTCKSKNVSTMRDLVKAMNIIRTKNTVNSNAIIAPMTKTAYTFNHTDRVFNKCGLNSKSLGDVGVFEIEKDGIKKQYVYAAIVDFPNGDGGYYDSRTEPLPGKSITNQLTDKRDPISKATQWLINDIKQGFVVKDGSF
jgi:D-alanyl-D-alanine carboxypeptidase